MHRKLLASSKLARRMWESCACQRPRVWSTYRTSKTSFLLLSKTQDLKKKHKTICISVSFRLACKMFFFYPAFTTLYEFEPPPSRGSEITHKDTPQSVGLLWTSDQPIAETSTWQHTQHSQWTTIHAPGELRTHNASKRSVVDTRLRPLGHWDRQNAVLPCKNYILWVFSE